jgi:nitric oxide reductase NorD protein
MSLDELVFGKIAQYFKSRSKNKRMVAHTVILEDIRLKSQILASALCERNIDIYEAEKEGGYKNDAFFLPRQCSFFSNPEDNLQFYLFRIIYIYIQKKLGYNWKDGIIHSDEESLAIATEYAPQVLLCLYEEFPFAQRWHEELAAKFQTMNLEKNNILSHWLYGKWMTDDIIPSAQPLLQHIAKRHTHADDIQTILKAKAIEYIRSITVDKKAQEDYVLTHNFEKVETADGFSGTWRDFDGDDDLKAHEHALDELTLNLTVRVDDPTHSVYATEFQENMTISESSDQDHRHAVITYPEWDYNRKAYKENFCTLYPSYITDTYPGYYQQVIDIHGGTLVVLKKILANMYNRLQYKKDRYEGEDIDIDAAIGYFTDIHVGTSPNENIYIEKKKLQKEISVLILIDQSLSSDGYVQGKKILDMEKEAAILLGEILADNDIDFCVAGFHSHTRNHAEFQVIKDFEEPWHKGKMKIGTIHAQGYTRIGTALRHAAYMLSERPNMHRWLIMLTDGKPNDYDRYEGQYGIHDVRQALKEMIPLQIHTHVYAIEAIAKLYLPRMFGDNQYQIISSPQDMVTAFSKLLIRMKAIST